MTRARVHAPVTRLVALVVLGGVASKAAAGGDPAAGKRTFDVVCVTCHGAAGEGNGPMSAALAIPPRDFSKGAFRFDADGDGTAGEDSDLRLVIKNGAESYGGSPDMTAWRRLEDAQLDDLVSYIRTLRK